MIAVALALPYAVAAEPLATQPSVFIENRGQWDLEARYLLRSNGLDLWLTNTGLVYDLRTPSANATTPGKRSAVFVNFLGATPDAVAQGHQQVPGYHNYFLGNDRTQWAERVPLYQSATISRLYDGIDAIFYLDTGRPRYDLVVAPGADVAKVEIEFKGATSVRVAEGALVVATTLGEVRQQELFAYQMQGEKRQQVPCRFLVGRNGNVRFAVGSYDRSRPLVIDPVVMAYSTYLGGSAYDQSTGIAADNGGNAYVTGVTGSPNFPTGDPEQPTFGGGADVFVTKLTANGELGYSTYLGGSDYDQGNGIAIDNDGNVSVVGYTSSSDFPTRDPLQATKKAGYDAIVMKLGTGGSLIYSTFLGGSNTEQGLGIAADRDGSTYITGYTDGQSFPTKDPLQPTIGGMVDVFIAKLSQGGELVYSTFLGGSNRDWGTDIAVDNSGNAYVTGYTSSSNFPTKDPRQTKKGDLADAFVVRLSATGTLVYSSYLGGTGEDRGAGIAVDSSGSIYITGFTTSPNFAARNPQQSTLSGACDAFVTKLTADGSDLLYSTFLGGSHLDFGSGLAVDNKGNAYITGNTSSPNFPLKNPQQPVRGGSSDAFVAKFTTNGVLVYSSYLGGSDTTQATSIAVDNHGNAYVTGFTQSPDFPTQQPLQAAYGGANGDAFVTKFSSFATAELRLVPNAINYNRDLTSDTVLMLSNIGEAPMTLDSLMINGAGASAYTLMSPSSLPQTIAPYDSLALQVRHVPSGGRDSATLKVVTSVGTATAVLTATRVASVGSEEAIASNEFSVSLISVRPNPAGERAEIVCMFRGVGSAEANIALTDLQGRIVENLYSGRIETGKAYHSTLDLKRFAAGSYMVVVQAAGRESFQQLVVVK